jgi:hypothetical protein
MSKQHQALFTELTTQQAEAIQGGLVLKLHSLKVNQSGSDTFDGDDPLVKVNGNVVFAAEGVKAGDTFALHGKTVGVGDLAVIEVFDADGGFNGGDDLIRRSEFSRPTGLPFKLPFSNGNSSYTLEFEIF